MKFALYLPLVAGFLYVPGDRRSELVPASCSIDQELPAPPSGMHYECVAGAWHLASAGSPDLASRGACAAAVGPLSPPPPTFGPLDDDRERRDRER